MHGRTFPNQFSVLFVQGAPFADWSKLASRTFQVFLGGGDEQDLSSCDKAELEQAANKEPWVHEVKIPLNFVYIR